MRRLSFVIGPALLLAGGLNLLAQHSGGHPSGGHASASGSHFSGAPGSTTYSTLSNHHPSAGQAVFPTPIGLQHQYSGFTGINPGALSNGNRRGDRRYGYGAGLWYPPLYLSTFDDSPTPYVYNATAQDPSAQYADMNANALGDQVAQLSAQVEALRNERAVSNYAPAYNAPITDPPADNSSTAPVTLVTKSGKQLQVKNYAVMGQYIWDFSVQPAKRIAISSLDLNASRVVTEGSGGEFPQIAN